MKFDFDKCVVLFRKSLLTALEDQSKALRKLNKAHPLQAMAFDLLPWDPYAAIGFRMQSEAKKPNPSDRAAGWKHGQFIVHSLSPPMEKVATYAAEYYNTGSEERLRERAHVLFMAAAHALLDKSISNFLREHDIYLENYGNTFEHHFFEFFVIDTDQTYKSNYCDLVLANRVTYRMLKKLV